MPSEKCAVSWGSNDDEMRMITASFVRAIERLAGDLCRHFLPLFQQVVEIRKTCNQLYLKPGGVLRLAVPDGFNPSNEYIEYVRPGGTGPGADDHKVLYTYKSMKERLERAGFKINLLEYWDKNGKFHYTDWTDEGGRIRRSRRYDPRNQDGRLHYTSLIVDAIKPLNS